MTVITDISQISLDWLNLVLIRQGALVAGRVQAFDATPLSSTNARFARVQLHYEAGAAGELPAVLLLKMCSDSAFGPSEMLYYTRDYVGLPQAPLPRCYDSGYGPAPGAYHILMDDLSATHAGALVSDVPLTHGSDHWQVRPTLAYGRSVAQSLATLHAYHWGAGKLAALRALPDEAGVARYMAWVSSGLDPMLKTLGDEISPSWKRALLDIFQHHPEVMTRRTRDAEGFTLVHGDVSPGNVLSPLAGEGRSYLIDRQPFDWSLTTWLGVSDLAYMMVHWWESDLRRELELLVLREYHTCLLAQGIASYSWEQLLYDYKLTAVQSIYVASAWCVDEDELLNMKWLWSRQLHKALTAVFDLGCRTLWAS